MLKCTPTLMTYNPAKHHRSSIRLKGHDYSSDAFYFITLIVHERRKLFGQIINKQFVPTDAGKMVAKLYHELEKRYPDKICHAMVVMPDHFHCIIQSKATSQSNTSLAQAIGWYKAMSTCAYIRGVKELGWPAFRHKLWQRNYYEHIIRGADAYERITHYILTNPSAYSDRL